VTTLVDANVLLDVLTGDPKWAGWSEQAIATAAADGLAINPIILAEVGVRFERSADVDAAVPHDTFERLAIPWAAAHPAGQAYLAYRRRGGGRRAPLSDFYIGAHALVSGLRILTRDAARYRTYFPDVKVVSPSFTRRG
jgi:predicted nucleic acid-binding protein